MGSTAWQIATQFTGFPDIKTERSFGSQATCHSVDVLGLSFNVIQGYVYNQASIRLVQGLILYCKTCAVFISIS